MTFKDVLRNSRSGRTTALHKFRTNYDPNSQRVYLFVEGEPDKAFYRSFVGRHVTNPRDVFIYNCENKDNVYRAHADVLSSYPNCERVLFFVDKDIDDILGKQHPASPRVFVTECYSIENYVVSPEAVARYFSDYVKVNRVEFDIEEISRQFGRQLAAFYQLILPIMAWILVMRRRGERVQLQDVKLSELFEISDHEVVRKRKRAALSYLERVTGTQSPPRIWALVRNASRELLRLQPDRYVRGKFVGWLLILSCRKFSEELTTIAREVRGSVSQPVQLNEANFIQLLCSGTTAPAPLETFLRFHLGRGVKTPSTAETTHGTGPRSFLSRLFHRKPPRTDGSQN